MTGPGGTTAATPAKAPTARFVPTGDSRYRGVVLSEGVVLSDRYRLAERLATGGMGDVWRGTDLLLGRDVAIKVLLPALVSEHLEKARSSSASMVTTSGRVRTF